MHILAGRSGRIDEGDEAVDLEQTPADVVFLSAADTELASLAGAVRRLGAAAPSVRLASLLALSHPYSVDLYAERTLQGSRLVILRLLGGAEYWPYGLERLGELANGYGVKLAVMPGDDRWDAELAARSTLGADEVHRLWRYCADGGADNLANLLGFARHLLDGTPEPDPPRALPRADCSSGLRLPTCRLRPSRKRSRSLSTSPRNSGPTIRRTGSRRPGRARARASISCSFRISANFRST